jgi:hypothetical protein
MEILDVLLMVITALYFCWSSNAHKMMQRICKAEGLVITIMVVVLCIGCWQLFWVIQVNPSLADKLKLFDTMNREVSEKSRL